jgi:hypothetical protein
MKAWDVGNIFQLEEMVTCGGINVDINLVIAFYIEIAIAGKNGINPIWLLERGLIETAEVVADINRGVVI